MNPFSSIPSLVIGDDHNFGRVEDRAHVDFILGQQPHTSLYGANPALAGTSDKKEICLWEAEEQATGEAVRPPHNQGSVGICTGEGTTGAAEDLQFIQIAWRGQPGTFKWLASEPLYGGGRQTIGRGAIWGDGAATSWLIEYAMKYGLIARGKYGDYDLSKYNETNARWYGKNGVPDALLDIQKQHVIQAMVQPKSAQEACDGMINGFPCVAGSDCGFNTPRDSQGFCRAKGKWSHCTYYRGCVNYGPRPCVFYQQSWGPTQPGGPMKITLPSGREVTLPAGCFCVDMDDFERYIVAAKDIYLLSAETSFEALDYKFY